MHLRRDRPLERGRSSNLDLKWCALVQLDLLAATRHVSLNPVRARLV
jgi:hypothetical protein